MSHERLLELEEAVKEIKYDVIGLSETRRAGTNIEEYENFILCHVGHTPGQYGVGFIINKLHKNNIESFIGITERVAVLNMKIQGYLISIIQVYAPTSSASSCEIDDFYKTIDSVLDTTHKNIILMGDFNAKIGFPRPEEHLIAKQFGYGIRNNRGQKLMNFASEHKLTIINTCFKKKPSKRWTWKSPCGKYKNELDYILSNQPRLFQNIGTMNLNYPSDHRIIRATLKLAKLKKSRTKYTNKNTSLLKYDEEVTNYRKTLSSMLSSSSHRNLSVQAYYDSITNAITKSLSSAKQKGRVHSHHKVLSARTTALLRKRKELQKIKHKSRPTKNKLRALFKLVNKYIRNDYESYRQCTLQKHLHSTGSTKKAYKQLRTNITWIEGLTNSGRNVIKRKDIITTATEFYKNLYSYNHTATTRSIYTHTTKDDSGITIKLIDEKEVIETIKKLKLDKSPGSDNITNEALKFANLILAAPLAELFNLILKKSETPKQWSESNIILIYKKGDPKDIGNYRPISLLPSLYKLFSTIINLRIGDVIESKQPVEQAGFRKGYSTVDHIYTLELIIEKYREQQKPLYLAFIDYKKAFDTVTHDSVWNSLTDQGVSEVYINVIRNLYCNNIGRIKLERLGPVFPIMRGVRQGDPLSPTIFIAILETIFNKLNWTNFGINIQGKYLSHLRFADDIVILSETSSQLQLMIETLQETSANIGLEINPTKTRLMTNSLKKQINMDGNPLEYENKYIYLGKTISFEKENNELEIDRRIQKTWNKFWGLKEIFKSNMPTKLKTKAMNSSLLPCLTYGCQTWKFTVNVRRKITTCQRALERSMLKFKKLDKIQCRKIRAITKATDALSYSKKLKWKWAGHVARLKDDRWAYKTTIWRGPIGKRGRGRPCTRWEDDIIKTAGFNWKQTALDREKWLYLEEAYTHSGDLA